jgi:hypothetical protein
VPTALAAAAAPPAAAAVPLSLVANFPGISFNGWFPYDATLAAGPEHVMAAVNARVAFYTKGTGTAVLQRTLVQWFSGVVQNAKIFDPKVLYDQFAGRWVLLAVGLAEIRTVPGSCSPSRRPPIRTAGGSTGQHLVPIAGRAGA